MTLVKICGIRELEHAEAAAREGADLIGFVFVPVPREVSPEGAAKILSRVRTSVDRPPLAVGLFVNERAEKINRIAEQVDLDIVQLSGSEGPELAASIERPVIKALRIEPEMTADEFRERAEAYLAHCVGLLIDSHVAGRWGGTGVVGDWKSAALLADSFPVILAGGLNPENVRTAIERVNPAVVDVSSGVEKDGRKDSETIAAFIQAARAVAPDERDVSAPFTGLIDRMRSDRARQADRLTLET